MSSGEKDFVVRCYYCGRKIGDEEGLVMKEVSLGLFRSERKPFHEECWERYHSYTLKKNLLAAAIFILLCFGLPFFGGAIVIIYDRLANPHNYLYASYSWYEAGFWLTCFLIICLTITYFLVKEPPAQHHSEDRRIRH